MASLFSIFTGLSITIAVIGLVGLVSYSAEQRKKEIGIRKVFGASLSSDLHHDQHSIRAFNLYLIIDCDTCVVVTDAAMVEFVSVSGRGQSLYFCRLRFG